jgi:hypothetical protein
MPHLYFGSQISFCFAAISWGLLPSNETTSGMGYRSKNATKECGAERDRQQRAGCAVPPLRLRRSQPGKAMAYKRGGCRLQQKRLFWIGKFG